MRVQEVMTHDPICCTQNDDIASAAAIMTDVTSLMAGLRNEEPPATPYDMALQARTAPAVTEAPEDSPA